MQETALYAPIKAYLEGQGYGVKSEVNDCDLVALREGEAPVVVEMKLSLSLALLLQGVDRLAITDAVYVAVPAGSGRRWLNQVKDAVKLCRRLGLGLISVRFSARRAKVDVHVDPGPYQPRKTKKRTTALLREFERRVGDPNTGGQTRRPIVTAYRQDALRIAASLNCAGRQSPAKLALENDVPKAGSILQNNHYGWFSRVSRGIYELTPNGQKALETYQDVVSTLNENAKITGLAVSSVR